MGRVTFSVVADSSLADDLGDKLLQAILAHDKQHILSLLDQGADPKQAPGGAGRCLNSAIANGIDVQTLQALLQKCHDVLLTDDQGNTPLHAAVMSSRSELISVLLQHDSSMLTSVNRENLTAVQLAAAKHNHQMGAALLAYTDLDLKEILSYCRLETADYDTGFLVAYLRKLIHQNQCDKFFQAISDYEAHLGGQDSVTKQEVNRAVASLFTAVNRLVADILHYKRFDFLEKLAARTQGAEINFQEQLDYVKGLNDSKLLGLLFKIVCEQLKRKDSLEYVCWLLKFLDPEVCSELLQQEINENLSVIKHAAALEDTIVEASYLPYKKLNIAALRIKRDGGKLSGEQQMQLDDACFIYDNALAACSTATRLLQWYQQHLDSCLSATPPNSRAASPVTHAAGLVQVVKKVVRPVTDLFAVTRGKKATGLHRSQSVGVMSGR